MIEKVDALVVGARCAGAATAMLMARAGMKVLAIDRSAYGSDTLSTHALMRAGVLLLGRWGVLPSLVARGTPPVRRTEFHYGHEVVEVPIRPGNGVDALYAPRRTVLDAALADAAQQAGAELRFNCSLVALHRQPCGRIGGATLRDATGTVREVAAGLVVGADGLGSPVARLAGAPVQHVAQAGSAVIYGYWPGLPNRGYQWLYRPGISAGIIPTNDGLHCIFAAAPPTRYRNELRFDLAAGYRRVLEELSPEIAATLEGRRNAGGLHVFAGRPGFMRRPFGPGWALVGDAGYFKDPLTAHGITDALRDAHLLAMAAVDGTPPAFATYAALRDALSLPFFEATEAIAGFGWDLDTLKGLHARVQQAMKREVALLAEPAPPRLPIRVSDLAAIPC